MRLRLSLSPGDYNVHRWYELRRFATGYSIVGTAGFLLAVLLDSQAIFSLLSYVPLVLTTLAYSIGGIVWAARRSKKMGHWTVSCTAVVLVALLVSSLSLFLPQMRTSPRKGFHLDAANLRHGMDLETLEHQMAEYEKSQGPGYIAFVFRAGPHTEDRVIVDLTPEGTAEAIEVVTN